MASEEEINKQAQKGLVALMGQIKQNALQAVLSDSPPPEFDSIREPEIPAGANPLDKTPIISDPLVIFSNPLTKDAAKAVGLLGSDGNATEAGQLFFHLTKRGIFDDKGVLTPKGRAYSLSDMELRDPANIKEFSILWEDEVIRESASAGEIVGGVGNLLKEAALGVVELAPVLAQNAYYQFDNRKGFGIPFFRPSNQDNRPQSLKDKTIAAATSTAETWTKNFTELKGLADVGANLFMRSAGQLALDGLDPELDAETYLDLQRARQRQWSDREVLGDMEVGEVAETILSIEGAVAEAQEVKKRMGEEEFNKVYGRVGSTMQIASPENAIPGLASFNFAKGPALASRLSLLAQKTVGTALELQQTAARASLALAENQNIITKNALVQARANRIIAQGGANAPRAKEILDFSNKAAREAQELIPDLTKTIESSTQQAAKLSSRIPVAAAEATLKVTQVGRNLRAMPAKAVGTTLEGFGNTLTKVDDAVSGFLKERGFNQAYTAAVGAAGVVGLAGSPVIGAVAGGAAILKAGKFISNYGKFFKYVGKTMAEAKGQIPFWKRVAAHTEPGSLNRGIAHTFNMLDLGGVTSDTLRRIPRGVAAAYPVDLMFEWLSDGADMRPQTFLQAGAESLVIGGSFAAAGGAFMGTEKRMRELSIGDQLNLVQGMTDDRQKALYYTLPSGVRSAVATYGIANPTLIYNFKDSGSSEYDPNSNTASINVKSNNPIRPLIAHETLHHTIVKNNMEGGIAALFLGDTINNTVGGLLRSRDGKLDPNFEAFRDRYYQRLNIAGMTDAEKNAIYPLEKVAVEYFIEQHSDQYAEMAESGELGAIAASGDIKRKLSGVLETVLPRIPVLRDLHFKSGGMIDKNGGWVTGNGILDAEGVRTNPITNKMFRDMNRRSSGRSPGQFDPLVSDKQESGAQITLDPTKAIDSELLHPLVKVDENGRPILVNGQPVALDKATLLERALAGLTAKEVLRRKKAENYIPEKGEAYIDELGEYVPGWLSNNVLSEMFAKNRFNPEQKRIIREVNRMIREGNGGRAVMINFPATTRNKSGKAVYKPQGATLRDTVPVAITISKDGNLLFGLMSVTKLQENIKKRSQSRLGKKLYGGNVDLILRDTQAMMQFHKDGVDSIEYFKSKYGAVEADERKKFINTMFGLLNKSEQAVLNPMLIEDGVKSKDNVYRTYRADRVSKAVAMSPEDYPAMPFSYEAVSQVKMPEQARQMPEVAVVPERFTGSATDTDRRGKYVEPPGFFRKFNIDSYERGGRFFDAASGEDLTGKQYSTGSIDVSTGKPRLFVDNVSDATPSGSKFKTNLFKQRAGWKWTSENPPPTSTIVSVEGQGKHIYTLKANFEGGVELARYSEKASEPRLRPTGYGDIRLGNKVGEISIRGKAHPVYDSVGIIPKVKEQARQMPEKPITSSSEEWKSMSNKEKDAYVFTPVEMTPSNRAEFDSRVESGSLSADTPVVDINRSSLLTSKYGPPSSSATGNINTWIDDDTGKPVAVAFSENGNIPTKGEWKWNQTPRYMPEAPKEGWNPNPIRATNAIAKDKGIPNKITEDVFSFLEGKPIVVGMADLLGAGGKIRGVSVTGGPGYPVQMFDQANPSKITAVWASQEQGIRAILQNMEKTNSIWKDESGHNWAIYSPHTMSQSAHKSNAQTPQIYISKVNTMAERGALSKESAIEISKHIRENVPSAVDMPNIGTLKLSKFIEDASFETRAAIMTELTTARSRSIGAPAPESILTESRDIQYQGVGKNSLTSLLLIDIDRMATQNADGKWQLRNDLKASDFGVEAHPSYDTIMPGRILAHFDNPVPFEVAAPEMIRTMSQASPKSRPDYLLTKLPSQKGIVFQPLTKEIAATINSIQDIKGNVPYTREVVKAATGNWKKFSGKDSLKGLKEFTNSIERSPAKESLTQYDPQDVKKMVKMGELDVYQLGDNDIWFGVKKTQAGNDLVSVVNNTGIPGMLNVIMAKAIEAGVNTLDASSVITPKTPNGLLPTLYERYGWKETGRDKFDRKYLVERSKSDTKAQHEAKITQKEASLKMFWEEQGWDGKTMPDIVYMKLEGKINGKQTGTIIDERQESVFAEAIGSTRASAKTTTSKVRGSGLSEGQGKGSVGGTPTGTAGADSGVLPRGFDSVIETIRSASDIQLKSMGLTLAEKKKFLDRYDK